jgi:polar amino acid transport system substrate-binding protein
VNAIIAEARKAGDLDKLAQKWLGRTAGQLPE